MKKIQNEQKYIQINNKPVSNNHEKPKPKINNLNDSRSVNRIRQTNLKSSFKYMLQNNKPIHDIE